MTDDLGSVDKGMNSDADKNESKGKDNAVMKYKIYFEKVPN